MSDAAEIEAIRIYLPGGLPQRSVDDPEKWHPKNRETADHSVPYLVAVALLDGTVTPASFDTQRIQDPELHSIISRMNVEEDPEYSRSYPDEINCRIEITTVGGKQLAAQSAYPKGHPRNPMTNDEINTKFRSLAAELLTAQQCERALSLLWSLDEQPNLKELFDALVVQAETK